MRPLAAYGSLGRIDARNVARDPMLRWIVILTPAFGLLVRFVVPPVAAAVERRFGVDLVAYYPLITSFLLLFAAGMVGAVVGFILLDQRDDQTITALLVTPLSLGDYLRYRLVVLLVLSVALSCVTVPLAGLVQTTWPQVLVSSVVAAPIAPIYALFLCSFADNKVQGFALAKVAGIVIVPCVAAYFVAGPWQNLAGVVPHYWPMKVFWLFDAGAPGMALAYAAIGLAWQGALLVLFARRFSRIVRR